MYKFFSVQNFLPVILGFIIILLLLIFSIKIIISLIKDKEKLTKNLFIYSFFTILIIACSYILIGNSLDLYNQYKLFAIPYMNDEYYVVEGTVKDFKGDDYGRENSFYIDDVYFEYSLHSLNDLGFSSPNDYIYNGNQLSIKYVYVEDTNVIMEINEFKSDKT